MALWDEISGGGNFAIPPEGLHPAVCVDVEDLGVRPGPYGQKHECRIIWQLETLNPETKKRFIVSAWFTVSLAQKSKLRPFLEAWRGSKFTPEYVNKFRSVIELLESVVGANGQLQVIHHISKDGKSRARVQAAIPPRPTDPKLHPQDYVRHKDRPTEHGTGDGSVPF